jgi:hypothetical protein
MNRIDIVIVLVISFIASAIVVSIISSIKNSLESIQNKKKIKKLLDDLRSPVLCLWSSSELEKIRAKNSSHICLAIISEAVELNRRMQKEYEAVYNLYLDNTPIFGFHNEAFEEHSKKLYLAVERLKAIDRFLEFLPGLCSYFEALINRGYATTYVQILEQLRVFLLQDKFPKNGEAILVQVLSLISDAREKFQYGEAAGHKEFLPPLLRAAYLMGANLLKLEEKEEPPTA